ncbi:hypothetical protein MLD38_020509 [Melastoma candidum]|uniref:Uncharacterized protein n=1 Tax=Melastoma candidum TaxID=119954 RepID=A0ACB9QGZ2_9MYRT|nr:hypothetical protein MLD38_020509 [Melastoma candidum]
MDRSHLLRLISQQFREYLTDSEERSEWPDEDTLARMALEYIMRCHPGMDKDEDGSSEEDEDDEESSSEEDEEDEDGSLTEEDEEDEDGSSTEDEANSSEELYCYARELEDALFPR